MNNFSGNKHTTCNVVCSEKLLVALRAQINVSRPKPKLKPKLKPKPKLVNVPRPQASGLIFSNIHGPTYSPDWKLWLKSAPGRCRARPLAPPDHLMGADPDETRLSQ